LKVHNLNESVDTLTSLRTRAEQGVSLHQRRIERFTAILGRPRSLYLVIALAAVWGACNLGMARVGARPWDPPPFPWLQGVIGLCALLMTITILTTQNRLTRHADERAQLDLKINLLTEQKVAKVISLLEELRRDIPTVRNRVDKVAEVMKKEVDPHAVLSALEGSLEAGKDRLGDEDVQRSGARSKDK
jgi:uncharacterized membrane protein